MLKMLSLTVLSVALCAGCSVSTIVNAERIQRECYEVQWVQAHQPMIGSMPIGLPKTNIKLRNGVFVDDVRPQLIYYGPDGSARYYCPRGVPFR